jgi:hypothetical protein
MHHSAEYKVIYSGFPAGIDDVFPLAYFGLCICLFIVCGPGLRHAKNPMSGLKCDHQGRFIQQISFL